MDSLSRNILSVLLPFSVLFSKPSWKKPLTLLLGTLLCTGKRTVCSAPVLMGLYSCVCVMANQLRQVELLKVQVTAWHQKEHVTFSDMLRAVRMVIWRDNLISRKGKITPSLENMTPEMADWVDDIVRRVLQAA